jgi:glycosyltransferase involved in cell wall biosynthesis
MKPVPILFLGDAPHLPTGLARIGRDLATHVSTLPQFRVGYLGRGGWGSSKLPFAQYYFPEYAQWGEGFLEPVWKDFAGEDRGILFSIWDASRLHWLASPNGIGGTLEELLRSNRFVKWGYFPVDSRGVGDRLTVMTRDTLSRYERVLAYGKFGAEQITASTGRECDWIPHGISTEVFTPRDRAAARMSLGLKPEHLVIGCVMANQARKDWGLAFAIIARLKIHYPSLKFWAHVDVLDRHWDLRALVADFNLSPKDVIITLGGQYNDYELSYCYSACDLTILPSLGEGFGYPVVESMACGIPCITGDYGGSPELIPDKSWLIEPVVERLDTLHNCLRPVFNPMDWVAAVEAVLLAPKQPDVHRAAVEHLDWRNLWPSTWRKWFEEGVRVLP